MDQLGGTRRARPRKAAVPARPRDRDVFVVDNHPIVRCGLANMLDRMDGLRCCGESAEGPRARRLIESSRPDLVITEISLRLGDGLDLARYLKVMDPSPRILVLSTHDESLFAERALRAGAHGYVCKREPLRTLLRAIRTVLSGRIYLSPGASSRLLARLGSANGNGEESPLERLTDRELQVLLLLGKGLGSREIAERLILSVKTIDTYREHLKKKLSLPSHNELIRFAVTWVLSPDKARSLSRGR